MVIKAFILRILPTVWLLFTVVSSGSVSHGILSKLYQRAVNEHRPLVLVLDAENGPLHQNLEVTKPHKSKHVIQEVQKNVKQTSELSSVPEDAVGDNEISMLKTLIKKISALVQNRGITLGSKKLKGPKAGLRTKEQLVAPLIRSLLRVSNDMNCAARDECEEKGETKNECEQKFECVEEKQEKQAGDCAVEDADECNDGELISTKGYTLEPEDNTCTRC